ncbi:MAG: four-carbon acid sugar kinase family protein [Spirochaetaceae bacterium]|nr:four-carbon acid sugar kinase family protein [Spirochaetaceae bacterium]MCF7948912.1 four-carbon acid sugar kinase family protein [Spirochaetia bacterium]MCF7951079.1 four-carbon acid sugar kinase family protein [Spirochaetaceae bacterium]
MKLGVIADDFTGATDIAGFLVKNGVKTIQLIDRPEDASELSAEAFVVSLKSRSCDPQHAVQMSLRALEWLLKQGCDKIYFKYCSTFDSTSEGNIGPVADAILQRMNADMTVVCPALPVNGRTLYQGYLFVHDTLLNESGMRDHPVTPMKDAKIRRVLESQTTGRVGEVHYDVIERGPEAVSDKVNELKETGCRYVVFDTLNDAHLLTIAHATKDLKVYTGGSGLGDALARLWKGDAVAIDSAKEVGRPAPAKTVIFSGSCSAATNVQVEQYRAAAASLAIDRQRLIDESGYEEEVFRWIMAHIDEPYAPMVYATTTPGKLLENKQKYQGFNLGEAIESLFGRLAARLLRENVRNYIVAGGETAGKIVQSLELSALYVGPQIDPGVPWMKATDSNVFLALKSGNFGAEDFFKKAQEMYYGT